tara:strand:+ start:65934 stop:67007 length:1074 start_codon:yes stop_codon:yes gene_type:complete
MTKLLIAASGTGGHIFPAIAVAEALPKSWVVDWLGVSNRLEMDIVPNCYKLFTVRISGLQGGFLNKIIQCLKLLLAVKYVISLIRDRDIDVLFTTGGYIAAPAILAAKICRIKVVIHESNAYPGKVTRFLGRYCSVVALGIPMTKKYLPTCTTIVTGTPVRKSFLEPQSLPSWVPVNSGPLIVVIGGSQGAIGMNKMVRQILPLLLEKGCRVVHITGENDTNNELINHPNFVNKPFTNEIPGLLQNADLAISRAGAGAISEFAVCNTPAVLIPFPESADQHQYFNAAFAAEYGAAFIVHQTNSNQKVLIEILERLLSSRLNNKVESNDLLSIMKKRVNDLAVREAHKNVSKVIMRLI